MAPGMDDGMLVEVVDGGHDAFLEFLLGGDGDMAEDGAGELGEEALDKIEPRAILGCDGEREAAGGLSGEPRFCLPGDA